MPQSRSRLVLLASKFGDISLIPPLYTEENYITVKDAIGSLPQIKDGESCKTDALHRQVNCLRLIKSELKICSGRDLERLG